MENIEKVVVTAIWEQGLPPKQCFGEIAVRQIDYIHRTAYASWRLWDANGASIAGVSRPYFVKEGDLTSAAFIKRAIDDIGTYRSGRKLVFSNVTIVKEL